MRNVRRAAYAAVGPACAMAVLAAIWQAAFWVSGGKVILLPSVADIGSSAMSLGHTSRIFADIAFTLRQTLIGLSLAVVGGVSLGLAIGSWRPLFAALAPVIDFGRSIPITTLYPVFVLGLGVGAASKVGMVAVASAWIIALNAAYGAQLASPTRLETARLYGASALQVFWLIRVPSAVVQTMIGLRVALSYAFVVEILAEMFMGSDLGLGQRVTEAYTTYRIADLYAVVLVSGAIGLVLNRLFLTLERKLVEV